MPYNKLPLLLIVLLHASEAMTLLRNANANIEATATKCKVSWANLRADQSQENAAKFAARLQHCSDIGHVFQVDSVKGRPADLPSTVLVQLDEPFADTDTLIKVKFKALNNRDLSVCFEGTSQWRLEGTEHAYNEALHVLTGLNSGPATPLMYIANRNALGKCGVSGVTMGEVMFALARRVGMKYAYNSEGAYSKKCADALPHAHKAMPFFYAPFMLLATIDAEPYTFWSKPGTTGMKVALTSERKASIQETSGNVVPSESIREKLHKDFAAFCSEDDGPAILKATCATCRWAKTTPIADVTWSVIAKGFTQMFSTRVQHALDPTKLEKFCWMWQRAQENVDTYSFLGLENYRALLPEDEYGAV
jgi:hypothetical protein